MVFPSLPLYHLHQDAPTWNQQQVVHHDHQQQQDHHHQQQQLQPQPGSIRPNSMADRARLAKIPQPEQALKCPRCDSTNTKFCYFNNYSLSQPRHFCKACRRYWTRGGAMRNVPVGGGCRRNNKRNKSAGGGGSSSKNQTAAADRQGGASSSSSAATSAGTTSTFPFMASLHPLMDYSTTVPNLGLGFSGLNQSMNTDDHYQQVGSSTTNMGLLNQIQQFPFLGGMEPLPTVPVSGMYPFDGASSVKMEDNRSGVNFGRQHSLGINISRNDQFWAGGTNEGDQGNITGGGGNGGGLRWINNLAGFNSSSTNGSLL